MEPEAQLQYESRARMRQTAVAGAAAVLLIIASVISLGGPHTSTNELTLDLLTANKRSPLDLVAAVVNGLASLGMAWTLVYVYRCARGRSDRAKPYIMWVSIVGGVAAAIAGVAYALVVDSKVHEFATTGAQTYQEASRLTSGPELLSMQLVGQAAALMIAVGFVLVSLQAMNTGLFTRFMGYLGMFAGALFLFQITQVPVVQAFWLLAIAYLLAAGVAHGPGAAVAVLSGDARAAVGLGRR
jgi:hypothetical protein